MENIEEQEADEDKVEKKLRDSYDQDLLRLLFKEIGTIKGSISKNRDELDRQKYMKLISEYKQFKKNKVQHFRFDSAAHATTFGKPISR